MLDLILKIKNFYERFERFNPVAFFFGGFTWDSITLKRIDQPLDNLILPSHDPDFDLLELDEALTSLATRDRRSAEVFQMRFFGGLTHSEISQVLGVTTRTVERDWRYARAWLVRGRPATP